MSVTVYGPPGCGKTRNAARIARHLGLICFIDDYKGPALEMECLLLTNVPTEGALDYFEVMRDIEEQESLFKDVPEEAELLAVAKMAHASHLHLITDGRRSVLSPFVPAGWKKHVVVQHDEVPA